MIPISFLDSGNYLFTYVVIRENCKSNHVLNNTDPPQINVENKLEKEEFNKTTDNSVKLIYDIEFPSNVLYSFNYNFYDNENSKIIEFIYGTNDTEHIERNINLPSSLTSNDHKLH